ncbi:MAG: hypothetical protein Q8P41_08790 [Pseudomonadota bacterium]|nr:hypothetical protein [Pseudomonadota bacterium]
MSGVDDLFSPEGAVEPPPPDRLRRIERLLAVALPLNVLGVFCFTGVPGALLALVGWQLADEEVARVESGALAPEKGPRARRMRGFAFGQLGFALLSLALQASLFGMGFYDGLLAFFLTLAGFGAPEV